MLKDLYGKKNEDEEENIQYYDDKEESTDKSEKDLSTFCTILYFYIYIINI